MHRLALFSVFFACGSDSDPSMLRSSSEPVAKSPVAMDLGGLQRPDGKEPLTASQLRLEDLAPWVPNASDLTDREAQVLLDAVNQTTAACEPCMTEGMSLGACLNRGLPSCSNLPTLAHRAFRVAIQGGDLDQAQAAISFVEPWQDLGPTSSEGDPVAVVFAVDYRDPFSHRAWKVWEALALDYGESLEFQFLHLPQERHEGAQELALLAMKARNAGREIEFHRAAMEAGEAVSAENISEVTDLWEGVSEVSTAAAESLLAEDTQKLARLGVSSTPVVWVDGYRVSGQRDIAIIQRFVDLTLADR